MLVADPPWPFGDKLGARGAEANYPVLSIEEICNFPLPVMADDSLLFMWRVSSMVEEAYRVVRAWGFVPKSEMVWSKTTEAGKPHFGMGRYVRLNHESCIIAARGRATRIIESHSVRSVFEAPVGKHSAKPDKFYSIVEELSGGPYVELFARRERFGWTCFGNELARANPSIEAANGTCHSTTSSPIPTSISAASASCNAPMGCTSSTTPIDDLVTALSGRTAT